MDITTPQTPADHIVTDDLENRAPDPRRHYASPEDLREDVDIDLASREQLLCQWKDEVDSELAASAEGMGSVEPHAGDNDGRLAAEARRVGAVLAEVRADLGQATGTV